MYQEIFSNWIRAYDGNQADRLSKACKVLGNIACHASIRTAYAGWVGSASLQLSFQLSDQVQSRSTDHEYISVRVCILLDQWFILLDVEL
jgi:hypothetical protein